MIVLSELLAILPEKQQVEIKDYKGEITAVPEKYMCLPIGEMHAQDSVLVIEIADVDKLYASYYGDEGDFNGIGA